MVETEGSSEEIYLSEVRDTDKPQAETTLSEEDKEFLNGRAKEHAGNIMDLESTVQLFDTDIPSKDSKQKVADLGGIFGAKKQILDWKMNKASLDELYAKGGMEEALRDAPMRFEQNDTVQFSSGGNQDEYMVTGFDGTEGSYTLSNLEGQMTVSRELVEMQQVDLAAQPGDVLSIRNPENGQPDTGYTVEEIRPDGLVVVSKMVTEDGMSMEKEYTISAADARGGLVSKLQEGMGMRDMRNKARQEAEQARVDKEVLIEAHRADMQREDQDAMKTIHARITGLFNKRK